MLNNSRQLVKCLLSLNGKEKLTVTIRLNYYSKHSYLMISQMIRYHSLFRIRRLVARVMCFRLFQLREEIQRNYDV